MATDPKAAPSPSGPRNVGIKIFVYPKVIYIFPTLIAALICGFWMWFSGDNTIVPEKVRAAPERKAEADGKADGAAKVEADAAEAGAQGGVAGAAEAGAGPTAMGRFTRKENLLSLAFLAVFAFNLLVMAMDFPRFSVFAGLVLVAAVTFFILWLAVYLDLNLVDPVADFLEGIYAVANAQFYFMFAAILLIIFGVIFLTRWLDYWEIQPNEILHHHGPLSDLERYPTFNLKFDKEIPDLLEHLFLGSGRLVLHVQNEQKSIVLDNVLWINQKEDMLKKMMSRMDVRIATDREVVD